MFLCPHQSHHSCRPQLLPLQHLQPSVLLQFEQGGIDAELFGTAVLEDVIDGDTIGIPVQVVKNAECILQLVIHVHTNVLNVFLTRTAKPSNYAYPSGAALGGTCGEEWFNVGGQDLEGVQLYFSVECSLLSH